MGRQSTYSDQTADHIIEAVENGTPLAEVCRNLRLGRTTVYDWQKERPEFAERFARARAVGFDVIAERLRATARGKTLAEGGDSQGDVQRDKLIIETDLKLLAKWDPKRYGDKLAVGGDEGGAPIKHTFAWLSGE